VVEDAGPGRGGGTFSHHEFDLEGVAIDPTQIHGRITIRNTGRKPWSADNYDLSLEYSTDLGGLFSAGVFFKEIRDFLDSAVRVATPAICSKWALARSMRAGN
jgi:outer membrane receptor protein involved in Fe transport